MGRYRRRPVQGVRGGAGLRGEKLDLTTLLGTQLAHTCTDPLVQYGKAAMEQCRANTPGYELEQVAFAS